MSKKIFLHIGCGKTGSSALQLWLHNNTDTLSKYDIDYPTFNQKLMHDYIITSGNGVHLFHSIQNNELQTLLKSLLARTNKNLLFSSEVFQGLSIEELHSLKKISSTLGIEIVVIAYMRDVYDIAYSSYLQLVKRHLYSDTFFTFCKSQKELQQFSVIKKYEAVFDTLQVVHYDSAKQEGIEKSFCRALGLKENALPSMEKKTINRSLTLYETEILKHANAIYKKKFNTYEWKFSHTVSDLLIYSDPEKKTEILMDSRALKLLTKTYRKEIFKLNKTYFRDDKLKLFDPAGKNIVKDIPKIPTELLLTLTAVMTFMQSERPRIDLVGLLAKEAEKKAPKQPQKALHIMQTAKILRPSGKIIDKMIEHYKKQVLIKK